MSLLADIVSQKRRELAELRARRLPAPPAVVPVDLRRPRGQRLRLICEIKRRSPSAGELSQVLGVAERARKYEAAGADMISVLCDGRFFGGSYDDLAAARAATKLPLLCKEFILDECQLDAARAYGASAALLIVRCMTLEELARLIRAAEDRGLLPLVEVTDEVEAQGARDAGARCFGVNARDLDSLQMDASRAARVLNTLAGSDLRCHFSGLKSPDAVRNVARGDADAALIGEALMRETDPTDLLKSFAQAAQNLLP